MNLDTPPKDQLIGIDDVQVLLGASKATIWRWAAEGIFPKPIPLSRQMRRWWRSEVNDWIAAKGRSSTPE
jgi:prophage regulatory protein